MNRSWLVWVSLPCLGVHCPSSDCGGCEPSCYERSVSECEIYDCGLVEGRPLTWPDPEQACYEAGDPLPLGCEDSAALADEEACPPVVRLGQGPDGTCYEFTGCLPSGFTKCPESEESAAECR